MNNISLESSRCTSVTTLKQSKSDNHTVHTLYTLLASSRGKCTDDLRDAFSFLSRSSSDTILSSPSASPESCTGSRPAHTTAHCHTGHSNEVMMKREETHVHFSYHTYTPSWHAVQFMKRWCSIHCPACIHLCCSVTPRLTKYFRCVRGIQIVCKSYTRPSIVSHRPALLHCDSKAVTFLFRWARCSTSVAAIACKQCCHISHEKSDIVR